MIYFAMFTINTRRSDAVFSLHTAASRCLAGLAIVSCLLIATAAWSAERLQNRLQAIQNGEEDEDDDDPQKPKAKPEPALNAEVFDQWLFQNRTEKDHFKDLQSQLSMRLTELEQACGLSSAQSQKIRFAGQIEIKQLVDRIHIARQQFERERHDQQNVGQLHQMVQTLQTALTYGLFREDALFEKVVRKSLDADQLVRYEKLSQQRAAFTKRARLEAILMQFERETPLREEQRRRLLRLWENVPAAAAGPYELQATWFRMTQIPEEKYREILNAGQWNAMQTKLNQVRGLEPWLQQNNLLLEAVP